MSEKLTITEALSEINLIKKKIAKKKETILATLVIASHLPDPHEKHGGSESFVKQEMQSIQDLSDRLIRIRSAIAEANVKNEIQISDAKSSIYDWLTFKREIADDMINFTQSVVKQVETHNTRVSNQPQVYKTDDGKTQLVEYKVNIDQTEWIKKNENYVEKKEKLDGQLSLKNATIVIEI